MYEEFNRFYRARLKRDMNKEVAKKNLFDFADLLEAENVPFLLIYGTLLGAVRDQDFISHDSDVDLATLSENYATVREICHSPKFGKYGFQLVRDSKHLISVLRKEEHIDLYFFSDCESEYRCMSFRIAGEQLRDGHSRIEFLGRTFCTVKNPVADLRWRYGDDWKTPKRNYHAPW